MRKVYDRLNSGRSPWDIKILYEAVGEIASNRLIFTEGEAKILRDGWRSVMDLHRDCFHDSLLSLSMIGDAIEDVKRLIEVSKNLLRRIERMFFSSGTVSEF